METDRTSRPVRRFDLGDAADQAKLQIRRKSMITRTSRVIAETFDELRFHYRIGRRELRRLCGPGFHSKRTRQATAQLNFQHDVALGLVRLHSALSAGTVGSWALRLDGTRSRLRLDDVPDMHFNVQTDWMQVIHFVSAQGWSYADFGELCGSTGSQISKLSWGRTSPRMPLGESVLWAARHIRDDLLIPRVRPDMALRRPAPRIVSDEARARSWRFPKPIADPTEPGP